MILVLNNSLLLNKSYLKIWGGSAGTILKGNYIA